jgi:P4 family phage/plasmid primase-like protien
MTTILSEDQKSSILYWPNVAGIGIFPADTMTKKIYCNGWPELDFSSIDFTSELYNGKYDRGIAVRTGRTISGKYYLIAIDLDGIDAVLEWFGNWEQVQGVARRTRIEWHEDKWRLHMFLLASKPVMNRRIRIKESLMEVKCENQALFVSPSIHKEGKPYTTLKTGEIAIINEYQLLQLQSKIDSLSDGYMSDIDKQAYIRLLEDPEYYTKLGVGQGRHNGLVILGTSYYYRYNGEWKYYTDAQRKAKLWEWNLKLAVPKPEKEFEDIWKWIVDKHRLTRDKQHEKLREERRREQTAQTNNQGIVLNLTERVMTEFTFKTMRDNEEIYYYDNAMGVYHRYGDRLIKEYVEILDPSIKTFQVNEIIQKIKRRTPVDRDQFDNNPDIINVQNGLLNIWTGELRDHSPDYLSIVQLTLHYCSKSRCPNIARFLALVLHPEDVLTALEVIGYTLYRTAIYEKAVMLHGNGDNGKGVFIKLIEAFVGSKNCSHVPLQDLDNDKFSSADLFGKLVNTFADLKSQKILTTGNFKTLVSGDSVRAQEKFGKPFSFRNSSKLIYSSNKIPDSDDKSYAYYKRWLILSFEKVFQGIARDTNLINKLTTSDELSGLLNIALISLRRLKKDNGFKEISVEKVKKEYEYNANTVKAFLDDKCTIDLTSPEYCIPTIYLYNEYENFCQERRMRALEINVFGSKLKEYGIEKDRIRSHGDREYYYFGVLLRKDLQGQNQSLL